MLKEASHLWDIIIINNQSGEIDVKIDPDVVLTSVALIRIFMITLKDLYQNHSGKVRNFKKEMKKLLEGYDIIFSWI